MNVGFAGAGNMAAAIARGWASAGSGPATMFFADSGSGRAQRLADQTGGVGVASLEELADRSEMVVLAVKPAALEQVSGALDGRVDVIASVLAATSLERLGEAFAATPVLRLMPNVCVEVRRGVVCHAPIAAGPDADALHRALEAFATLGSVIEVAEEQMDAATAVMGCAGAYLARACEELITSGSAAGLDPALSDRLVREMASGTGELLTQYEPAEIAIAIASRGGSTEAGLEAFSDAGGPEAFSAAVAASLERMKGTR